MLSWVSLTRCPPRSAALQACSYLGFITSCTDCSALKLQSSKGPAKLSLRQQAGGDSCILGGSETICQHTRCPNTHWGRSEHACSPHISITVASVSQAPRKQQPSRIPSEQEGGGTAASSARAELPSSPGRRARASWQRPAAKSTELTASHVRHSCHFHFYIRKNKA